MVASFCDHYGLSFENLSISEYWSFALLFWWWLW